MMQYAAALRQCSRASPCAGHEVGQRYCEEQVQRVADIRALLDEDENFAALFHYRIRIDTIGRDRQRG